MQFATEATTAGSPSLRREVRRIAARIRGERVSVAQILAALEGRAAGLVLLVLSIPAIVPTPGVPAGAVFGTLLLLVALRMATGDTGPSRLPRRLGDWSLPRRTAARLVHALAALVGRLERWSRPRLAAFAEPAAARLLGVPLAAMGLLIALPIPFGNVLPGLAVLLIGFGLAARDGAGVLLGLAVALVAAALPAALLGLGMGLLRGTVPYA